MGRLRIDEFYNKIGVCTSDEELISICNLEKEYITNTNTNLIVKIIYSKSTH